MKILLMRPPFTRLRKFGQAPVFPLGLGWIAGVLLRAGYDAAIYYPENPTPREREFVVHKRGVFLNRAEAHKTYLAALTDDTLPVWQEIAAEIKAYNPDLIGVSLLSTEVGSALKVSAIAKAINPRILIVWGGVHPSFEAESCLRYQEVDIVVRGEGEETMVELCQCLETKSSLQAVRGITWKRDGVAVHNPDRPLLESLDSLPMPARDAVIHPETFSSDTLGGLITSRGCPWRCTFCSSRRFWNRTVRFRSPQEVIKEIQWLKATFGIKSFTFWDDAFSLERRHAEVLCQKLIESKVNITWRGATRLDLIDPPLLRLMRRSGCTQLEVGIESGSPRILKEIAKDIDLARVGPAIEMIAKHGIACGVFFMVGFPQESLSDIEQTLTLMTQIKPAEMVLNVYDPLVGSELFELAQDYELVSTQEDWRTYALWPDRHFVRDIPAELFSRKVEELSELVFRYNRHPRNIARRAIPEFVQLLTRDPKRLLTKIRRFVGRFMAR